MISQRVDTAVTSRAAVGTRRGLVRRLVGLLFAGALALLLDAEVAGARRPVDHMSARAHRKRHNRQRLAPGQHKDNPTGTRNRFDQHKDNST
jgi:hypothetical protein